MSGERESERESGHGHGHGHGHGGEKRRGREGAEAAGERGEVGVERVMVLRSGHGANCSSVGSVIDTLFLSAAVGGAVFAAVCAAMKSEPIRIVGRAKDTRAGAKTDAHASADADAEVDAEAADGEADVNAEAGAGREGGAGRGGGP